MALALYRSGFSPSVAVEAVSRIGRVLEDIADRDVTRSTTLAAMAFAAGVIDERKGAELSRTSTIARKDPLTGLANRRRLLEELPKTAARATRAGESVALVLVDLEGFREVNERFGHAVGDAVLAEVSKRFTKSLRSSDLVARINGDTFAVVLESLDVGADVTVPVRRIADTVSAPLLKEQIHLKTTVGVSVYPADSDDPEELLHFADSALRLSKADRAGIKFYGDIGDTPFFKSHAAALRASTSVQVLYQPVVELESGKIFRYEALARLQNQGALLPPDKFLGALSLRDRALLFQNVSELVIEDLSRNPHSMISVNIEPDLLSGREIADSVLDACRRYGVDPHRLTVEITETEDLLSTAYASLSVLSKAGVRLSLDDFGTGYASLSRLLSYPFDEVKLDRVFGEVNDPLTPNLAMVALANEARKILCVDLIIEGVETAVTVQALRGLGIRYAQGYFFGQPKRLEHFAGKQYRPPVTSKFDPAWTAARTYAWERATAALAEIEPAQIRTDAPCALADRLTPPFSDFHLAQHQMLEKLVGSVPHTREKILELGWEMQSQAFLSESGSSRSGNSEFESGTWDLQDVGDSDS